MSLYSSEFSQLIKNYHDQQKKIVLVTGVFDLFHEEHQTFLQKAKSLGDILIVCIESDVRVKKMKGDDRPVWSQDQRKKELEKLHIADHVYILPEQFSRPEDHLKLLQSIRPAILAVSSHTSFLEQKQTLMSQVGGKVVVVHDHNPAISTTIKIQSKKP